MSTRSSSSDERRAPELSGAPLDRFALYECCVQDPERLVAFLRAIHGGAPTVLGEDFCGTAALSRAWTAIVPDARAIAVDLDAEVLARARIEHESQRVARDGVTASNSPAQPVDPLELVRSDVRSFDSTRYTAVDLLFVGNFSIGEMPTRADLLGYLRRSRERLAVGGVFVCDTYGGASAFTRGAVERSHSLPDGRRVRYTWEQRSADPRTARVENALHFRVEDRGEIVAELTDAFVYRWRLWSLPELRDALLEAGFDDVECWRELGDIETPPRPMSIDEDFGSDWIACLAARAASTR